MKRTRQDVSAATDDSDHIDIIGHVEGCTGDGEEDLGVVLQEMRTKEWVYQQQSTQESSDGPVGGKHVYGLRGGRALTWSSVGSRKKTVAGMKE